MKTLKKNNQERVTKELFNFIWGASAPYTFVMEKDNG